MTISELLQEGQRVSEENSRVRSIMLDARNEIFSDSEDAKSAVAVIDAWLEKDATRL